MGVVLRPGGLQRELPADLDLLTTPLVDPSKDYEYYPETSEAMVYLASIRLMLRRLAPQVDEEPLQLNC